MNEMIVIPVIAIAVVLISCGFGSLATYLLRKKVEEKPLSLEDYILDKKICPDCKGKEFLAGPRGGIAQNVKCAGCGSCFNVTPFSVQRI